MADWIRRLKAALTPQLVLLLLAALALIGYCTLRDQTGDETMRLENRHQPCSRAWKERDAWR